MGEPALEFVSCRRRRDRPAAAGPDAQHPGLGGHVCLSDEPDLPFVPIGGDAVDHAPGAAKRPEFRPLEQNENIFLTAYSGRGIVSYSGESAGGGGPPPVSAFPNKTLSCARAVRALRRAPSHDGAAMSSLDLFLPLAKVDLDRRIVTGVATAETPDRSGEICDYASSKPYFEKWSAEALAASGGKSLGAVRAMHNKIAAGKLTGIDFDDEMKRVVVSAKIVDDDEWRKVTEGVYTGFSQGGRYVKRWPDPDSGLVRYTAEPHEISLVDLPCLPDATFEVVKDGAVEKRAFAPRADAAGATADTPPQAPSLPPASTGENSEARANAAASRETSEAFFKAAGEL